MNRRLSILQLLSRVKMMPMWIRIRHFVDPVLQYVNQPVGKADRSAVWNPNRFLYLYKIELLEKCWLKECATKGQRAF